MNRYLEPSQYIDWTHSDVRKLAVSLTENTHTVEEVAKRCFEFVRDQITHCNDAGEETLTAKASEVLHAGTGFCYAKSHLLAALLRANKIPAALCYQRLKGDGQYTLHGLNAVHLGDAGWYRIDPRGNKPGINAQFTPPVEQLAFELQEDEENIPGYWSEPLPAVIHALTQFGSVSEAGKHLPDSIDQRLTQHGVNPTPSAAPPTAP